MDLIKIGKNIQSFRSKAGYTQAELAEIVNLSNTHISHLETGDGTMSLETLIDIAKALNTTPDYLLLGNIDYTPERAAQIFIDKTKNCTQQDLDCIFGMIDVLSQYKVTRK